MNKKHKGTPQRPYICVQLGTRGFTALEAVIGVTLVSLVLVYASHAIARSAVVGREEIQRTQAVLLAEEGLEVIQHIRDISYTSLSSMTAGTAYYLTISTTSLATTTTASLVDGTFRRTVQVFPAYRATSGDDLVASTSPVSKSIDPHTMLVTATVTWGTPTSTVSISRYLMNL
jgi:Tfp pilus assembly protein PilV